MTIFDNCLGSPQRPYESIDNPTNHVIIRKWKRTFTLCVIFGTFIAAVIVTIVLWKDVVTLENSPSMHKVMHITDPHVDLYFNPLESVSKGGCHSCGLAKYRTSSPSSSSSDSLSETFSPSKLNAECPSEDDIKQHVVRGAPTNLLIGEDGDYLFGRYGCDPPLLLWSSLLAAMRLQDSSPAVVVFTGDVSPHSYPDDTYIVDEYTTTDELCLTKFFATKIVLEQLVTTFPDTQWAYALGNNDLFPKNIYWRPYVELLGDMMMGIGFLNKQQHAHFVAFGSNFVDVEAVRYLSLNMNLFIPGSEFVSPGQESVVPALLQWLEETLADAVALALPVYLLGHQPLSTRFGLDEFDTHSEQFVELKRILTKHAAIIRVGLFGHDNFQELVQVLGTKGETGAESEAEAETEASSLPLFPAIVATGVSPRGPNQPSFTVLFKSEETGAIVDFVQHSFRLETENSALRQYSSGFSTRPEQLRAVSANAMLGAGWLSNDQLSWSALSGEESFTSATLRRFLLRAGTNRASFFSLQLLRRGGFIGSQVPESLICEATHDLEEDVARCMFPEQDPRCWDTDYWLTK